MDPVQRQGLREEKRATGKFLCKRHLFRFNPQCCLSEKVTPPGLTGKSGASSECRGNKAEESLAQHRQKGDRYLFKKHPAANPCGWRSQLGQLLKSLNKPGRWKEFGEHIGATVPKT